MKYIINLLWPTPENSYRPPVLKTSVVAFLMVAFLAWNGFVHIITGVRPVSASDLTTSNIIAAINRERQLRDLLTLNTNAALTSAAQWKAQDMINRNYFAHVDPDGNYIWPKIVAAGYTPYLQLGENLAIEFYDTDSLVAAWMNSPTHRENILNEGFKDQGMGLSFGNVAQGQYYSSIANTFGALATKTALATAGSATTAQPSPQPSPAPTPKKNPTPPAPKPVATSTPTKVVTASSTPIAVRGTGNTISSSTASSSTVSQQSSTPPPAATGSPAVVGTKPSAPQSRNLYNLNHYVILGFGLAFLFLLASDLRMMLDKKLNLLDKKLNNIFLLALALVVIALIYWL